jgi:hypothetical protein
VKKSFFKFELHFSINKNHYKFNSSIALHWSESCKMTNMHTSLSRALRGSSTIQQVKGESPWFGRVLAWSHPKQTLILILSISDKSRLTRGRGFI